MAPDDRSDRDVDQFVRDYIGRAMEAEGADFDPDMAATLMAGDAPADVLESAARAYLKETSELVFAFGRRFGADALAAATGAMSEADRVLIEKIFDAALDQKEDS